MDGMYGNGIALSEKVLDYLWGRQTVSLNNVANVDTPGFKSQYVTFEEEMAKRLSEASSQKKGTKKAVTDAIDASRSQLHTTWIESSRLDGNNVDIETENVTLAANQLKYNGLIDCLDQEFKNLRMVMK